MPCLFSGRAMVKGWSGLSEVPHQVLMKQKGYQWLPLKYCKRKYITLHNLSMLLWTLPHKGSPLLKYRQIYGYAHTFKVRSYPGIIARCPPHQFVQKIRGRHRDLPCPRSIVHLLTLTHTVIGTKHR